MLLPSRLPFPTPVVHYFCESWLTCHSTPSTRYTYRERIDALLATEQLLSVIPLPIRELIDVAISPARGWKGQVPTWFGIPCRVGRVKLWLPIEEGPGSHREFSLLVLLPEQELEDASPLIHLGTQFLLEYHADVHLDCSSSAGQGRLVIP
jgi:hypothetical protein